MAELMKQGTIALLAALLLSSCSSRAPGDQVLSIGDGDTITVTTSSGKTHVRLACIDAPEMGQRPAGPAARAALQALLPVGTTVTLQVQTTDRYGRTVAEVFKPGQPGSVNLQMVSQGMAFVYRPYLKGCDAFSYVEAETGASVSKRGIWGPALGQGLQLPWLYRKCHRTKSC